LPAKQLILLANKLILLANKLILPANNFYFPAKKSVFLPRSVIILRIIGAFAPLWEEFGGTSPPKPPTNGFLRCALPPAASAEAHPSGL
jgi:hypothetical protein